MGFVTELYVLPYRASGSDRSCTDPLPPWEFTYNWLHEMGNLTPTRLSRNSGGNTRHRNKIIVILSKNIKKNKGELTLKWKSKLKKKKPCVISKIQNLAIFHVMVKIFHSFVWLLGQSGTNAMYKLTKARQIHIFWLLL